MDPTAPSPSVSTGLVFQFHHHPFEAMLVTTRFRWRRGSRLHLLDGDKAAKLSQGGLQVLAIAKVLSLYMYIYIYVFVYIYAYIYIYTPVSVYL